MYCKNCFKSIRKEDNFCSNCGTKIDANINDLKDKLNKQYSTKGLYGHIAVKYDLISAKFVKIKTVRKCEDCKKKILPNELALTSSRRERYGNIRIWRCVRCGKNAIEEATEISDEQEIWDLVEDMF